MIPADLAEQVDQVYERLSRGVAVVVPMRIDGSRQINAYAQRLPEGGHGIVINAGLIDVVGYDADELAFVLAHELAHVVLEHLSDARITERRESASTIELLSMLADILVPLSGLALSAGHAMQEAGYSREQEVDADRLGVELMRQAGFDPRGALRFQYKLLRVSNPGQLNLLSSHPSGEARIEALEALVQTP
nr:M48 family metalloprotease [Motiliproteus sediminis]